MARYVRPATAFSSATFFGELFDFGGRVSSFDIGDRRHHFFPRTISST